MQGHPQLAGAALCGGFSEGRRQIDGQPLQVGCHLQLAVSAIQGQIQLIRQAAGQRQRLAYAQPVSQIGQRYLPLRFDAGQGLPAAALGERLGVYLMT